MSELFRELEEDIRRERYEKIWKAIGRFAVWGSIAIIGLTAVFVVMDNYNESAEQARTGKMLRGVEQMNNGNYSAAITTFSELSADASSSSYPLAMLQKAEAQELNGDKEGAKKTYAVLSNTPSEYGDLARLRAEVEASKTKIVFQSSYLEQRAWEALARGDKPEAAKLFMEIVKDENSPRSMAERANEVIRLIAPEKLTENKVVK